MMSRPEELLLNDELPNLEIKPVPFLILLIIFAACAYGLESYTTFKSRKNENENENKNDGTGTVTTKQTSPTICLLNFLIPRIEYYCGKSLLYLQYVINIRPTCGFYERGWTAFQPIKQSALPSYTAAPVPVPTTLLTTPCRPPVIAKTSILPTYTVPVTVPTTLLTTPYLPVMGTPIRRAKSF